MVRSVQDVARTSNSKRFNRTIVLESDSDSFEVSGTDLIWR